MLGHIGVILSVTMHGVAWPHPHVVDADWATICGVARPHLEVAFVNCEHVGEAVFRFEIGVVRRSWFG